MDGSISTLFNRLWARIWLLCKSHNLYRDLQKILKYPQPRRRSNSRINITTTQHHLHNLTMSSSKPTFNETNGGDILELTHANYDERRDDMIIVSTAMGAYAIITGEDPDLQPLGLNHDDNYHDWKAKAAEVSSIIRLSCAPAVWCNVNGTRIPQEMWNVLEISLDTTGCYIGRQDILRQFHPCWPKKDEPLWTYITKLSSDGIQLEHTDDAITNRVFRIQIFTSLQCHHALIVMVLKHRRPSPTPEEAMHDLLEEETTASLTNELGNASTQATLISRHGRYRGRGTDSGGRGRRGGLSGHSGHGGSSGTGDSHESKCIYCRIDSHTLDACWKWKRAQEGENNIQSIWF